MNLNKTINKKILEDIISKTFSNFGLIISSNLLDSLKLFGFHYATNSGISINIEDLRTPELKDFYIKEINNDIKFISHNWFEGNISYNERFYSIIDRWTITSETLKEKIVNYYKTFDPVNNLFIMAFSGARGNISQMHQLVGMRGLMSDQFGNVIDLPIQSNFREGLNLVDYIVSAYGARKGIVDTALKTADSGYLTRRLVYLAQDLIIRELDCGSKKGIILLITKEDSFKHLIGQKILNIQNYNYPFSKKSFKNLELNSNNLEMFKNESPLFVTIRSIITCISNGSLCQNCYGLNLSKQKQIELGSTVGIIAAQSIGEPGTQLTMRTFHTGGTFKSTSFSFLDMPASGIMQLLTFSGTKFIRTKYGDKSLKLNQNIFITLTNWKGNKINIQIKSNVLLNLFKTGFIYKNQRIGEILEATLIIKQRKIDPFYIKTSGKIISNIFKKNKEFLLNPYKLSVIPGYLGLIPIENKLIYSNIIDNNKTISVIKIISPINGIINIKDNFFILQKNNKNYYIDINELIKLVFDLKNKNFLIKLIPTFKNYQYIDNFSVIGFIYFFIKIEKKEKLFSLNKLKDQFKDLVFISTDNYHFKSYGFSEVNKKNKSKEISIVNQNNLKIKFNNLGLCIKQNKCNQIFNYIEGIHLGINSAISINKKNFYVFKNDLLGFSTIYSQHNNDIIQGLPKIEELIEARNVKNPAIIFKFSSTILQINSFKNNFFIFKKIIKNNINYSYNKNYKIINNPKKNLNNCILIKESLPNNNFFYYNNKLFKIKYFLTNLKFNNSNQIIKGNELINLKILNENLKWKKIKQKNNKLIEILLSFLYQNKNKNIISFLNKKKNNYLIYKTIIENNSSNYIINLNKNLYIFLENIKKETNSILLKKNIKLIVKEGDFIDIGEPISEGLIDSHSLLDSLFKYHLKNDGAIDGTLNSLIKFQLILSNSIQSIYFSQDVNVSQKHIEILAIQMLSKVIIQRRGDTPFFENELIPVFILLEILKILTFDNNIYKVPSFDLKLLSATSYSLNKDSFLSAAGFQETRRILIRAAIHGDIDWLRGLKETLITGKILPIGSTFLNFKNYLDNLYTFKE